MSNIFSINGGVQPIIYATSSSTQRPILTGNAALAVSELIGPSQKIAVSLGCVCQSLGLGAIVEPDPTTAGLTQKAYYSAPSQNYYEPDPLAPGQAGSYYTPMIQALANDIRIFFSNGGLGGMSLVTHALGSFSLAGWTGNTAYRGARASLANGDPGTKGDIIYESGRLWECTTGCTHLAFINSDTPVTVESRAWRRDLTYIAKNTDRTSSSQGSKPTFSASAAVGDTVVDNNSGALGGGLVWTCRTIGPNTSADGDNIRLLRSTDPGFDPYGLLARVRTAIVGKPVNENNRYCIVMNAQSDAGRATTLIARAHHLVGTYMAAEKIKTIHSMCIFDPASTQANYDKYETALSGSGLGGVENYSGSLITQYLQSSGYTFGIPGTTNRTSPMFYIMPSLYRAFGTDVVSMLQPQPNPHVTLAGGFKCAAAMVPHMRRILMNVA